MHGARRVVVFVQAENIRRLRELVQDINDWFGRKYRLAGLTIEPGPRAVMVWDIPPSKAQVSLDDLYFDALGDHRLRRYEDLWVRESIS